MTPLFPNRAAWLAAKLAERGWSKHDLQENNGPEHRTTQKILEGSGVQENVLLKVVSGLSQKARLRGQPLSPVALSDIPND